MRKNIAFTTHKCLKLLLSRYNGRFMTTIASDDSTLVRLALKGNVESAAELGRIYSDRAQAEEARHWLELAAEQDSSESQYLLGIYFHTKGETTEGKQPSKANGSREQVLREIDDAKKEARQKRKERLQKQRQSSKHSTPPSSSSTSAFTAAALIDKELTDAEKCTYWLRTAARAGHGPAMVYLGNVLLERHRAGSPLADGQEALLWYQKASALPKPVPDALFNLGMLCFSGQPGLVEEDLLKSRSFFSQAAALGDAAALYWIGHCYMTAEGGVEQVDTHRGIDFLTRAAEKGHPGAHYHLAVSSRSESKDAFMRHLIAAAEGEDGDALFMLSDLHLRGSSVDGVVQDMGKALTYLHRAVGAGHVDATVTLGAMYYSGTAGLVQDKHKAFELYNSAAEQGSKDAWRNLASMYFMGDGVPKSEEIAREIMKVIFEKAEREDRSGKESNGGEKAE